MCKPTNEGGQRCVAHTRAALKKAQAAYNQDPTNPLREDAYLTAQAQFASTPTGKRELEAAAAALDENSAERANLERALARGETVRRQNAEAKGEQQQMRRASDPANTPADLEAMYEAGSPGVKRRIVHQRTPVAPASVLLSAANSGDF